MSSCTFIKLKNIYGKESADLSKKKFLYENYYCEASKKAIIAQKNPIYISSAFKLKNSIPKQYYQKRDSQETLDLRRNYRC